VIRHLYPNADIPVIQLSLDYYKTPKEHYELARDLDVLRKRGILIIGSGNMVHNLRMIAWNKLNTDDYSYDWALEASNKMKQFILNNEHQELVNYGKQGKAFELAIPTPEHFLPLLYILGIKEEKEVITLFNDKAVAGSLTMTSLKVG
jgi:4,5-DOPA dioxygenase extradiol